MDNYNKQKHLLIADYGRSGQGWLSYMLCYILNAEYIEPYDFLHGVLYSSSERVRSLTGGNLPGREKTGYSKVIKTHDYPSVNFNLTDKIIYLSRDPRDVAVSAYFRYRNIAKDEKFKSLKNRLFFFIHGIKFISFTFTAYKWNKHFLMWKKQNLPLYFVKYEDLSFFPEKTLKGILNYLEVSVSDYVIKEAIDNFSFDKLSGRPKGQENSKDFVFRKGIVGDHKNHFSWIHFKIFKFFCQKSAKELGYKI